MTTAGYGDITPTTTTQTVYTTCCTILGPCVCALIIASAASYAHNSEVNVV